MRTTAEQLRADARGNRDQILNAALDAFRDHGTEVPMKEIADRAGVGVGTLYRRFPDRDALIVGVSHAHLSRLADLATAASDAEPTAWAALTRFLGECLELRLGALASAIEPTLHRAIKVHADLHEVRDRLTDRIDRMIEQARAAGDLRADIPADDVKLLMTLQVYTGPGDPDPAAAARVLRIVLDGLRPPGQRAATHE
ncbi:TetR/AcrR family transcriptional regulator [Nocardia inohanensis]|uniref:TetR/AcrR family transcriptional regulator n=1 Tax=Nocardia inohanensis TaxID=209246 RepID=UPI000832AF50|nr:TetR/AcrR family transcriptional regulator [Nocardia inohanensis]